MLRIEAGRRLVLYPEQLVMVADFFDGVAETLIVIPKKNGKTTLLAALALHHVLTVEDADCVIGASSREQATILYNQASRMIERSGLADVFKAQKGYRRITCGATAGGIRVLASDENTADGVIPTLALVDELHRHPSDGLYGVFRDGLGPRDGRMVTISTAGDDENSPLGRLRAKAYALPGLEYVGAHRHVSTPDFAMHEWALDTEDDRDNLELVKTANPAPWQTVEELRIRHDSPSMTAWQWARFACGVWLFGEQGAISEKEWRACEDAAAEIPAGARDVFVGVDLGWRQDSTAMVPVWRDEDGLMIVGDAVILAPPGDGSTLAYERVWEAVEQLTDLYSRPTFVLDPAAGGEQLAQQIDRELVGDVWTYSQQNKPMCLAAQRFSEAVAGRRLRHRGDQALSRHVLAAAPRPVGEMWRLVKPKTGAKIDAAVALAMAVSMLSEKPAEAFALSW
jgi:phage terminase large subunit-like protein